MAKLHISSGGIVFRLMGSAREGVRLGAPGVGGCYEVALIRVLRARGGTAWALPKGWVEQGEEPEQTAVREVREETGLQTRVLRKVDEISYQFYSRADHDRISKTVHLFLLECLGGDTADHDTEVEEARWFPIEEASQRLTYKNEREALEKAAVVERLDAERIEAQLRRRDQRTESWRDFFVGDRRSESEPPDAPQNAAGAAPGGAEGD